MTIMSINIDDLNDQLGEGVLIGSILCGERMTLGKTLDDVQYDLKLNKKIIESLEKNDLSIFDRQEFAPGNIRSYARYLKIDTKRVIEAYREQCGLALPTENLTKDTAYLKTQKAKIKKGSQKSFNTAYFTMPQPKVNWLNRVRGGVNFVFLLVPIVLVITIVGGSIYGLGKLFGSFQQLEIVPTETRPIALTQNEMAAPADQSGVLPTEFPSINYEDLYERQVLQTPVVTPRDGRIADIDLSSIGAFPEDTPLVEVQAVTAEMVTPSEPLVSIDPVLPGIQLLSIGEAWVRIVNADGEKVYENLMKPGQVYDVPFQDGVLVLRAGNATELFVRVNGDIYGPIGQNGTHVVSGVVLTPETLGEVYENVPEDVLKELLEKEHAFLAQLETQQ